MAYASLVFLEQQLEQLLPKHDDYIHLYTKEQFESLHSNVIFLQTLLEDFPGNSSSMIKQLESQITDIAYEVSDIISWGISKKKHRKTFITCIKRVDSLVENAKEIRKVLEMKTNEVGHDSSLKSSSSTIAAPSIENIMVGLETDLSKIKERIIGHNKALQIIPITGMGGIGKTTLAKTVYDDPAIAAHFDVRSWVTVSQEHNTEKILKEILGDAEKKDNETFIVAVHKRLSGRRFLIVVDDIWSVEAWDSIRNAFQDGNKGSRVVITTRLLEVAAKVGSSSPLHEMQLMNDIQSWELFQKEAFGEKERCPHPMEKVGKIISKNCKGLPLAIVVIARLLKLNYKQAYWESFERNMNEAMAGSARDNQVMEILSLSYDNLPPHLKACFLYMSMFAEDADIPAQWLKWLWVAEGFLKTPTDKSVEEVAEKCLLDLVDRNLLSVRKRSSDGSIRFCSVHDLLRDLSVRKAQEEKFTQQVITPNMGKMTSFTKRLFQVRVHRRCAGIYTPAILRFFGVNKTKYGRIYSVICDHSINRQDVRHTMSSKLVKVVDVLETILSVSVSFGVNLRYLAFDYGGGSDDMNAILTKVCKLQNLETLIIAHLPFSETLIFPILEMPKLKHFVLHGGYRRSSYFLIDNHNRRSSYFLIDNSYFLIDNHNRNSNTSLLKTLSGVWNFELTTYAVDTLANLVKLKIWYILDIIDHFGLSNLVHLHQLENLNLYGIDFRVILSNNIAFPDKLKKITLRNSSISWETMSVMGSLPNLQVLKLDFCQFENNVWKPVEGEFQQLKYLTLEIRNLKEWKVESTHFPCLVQLKFDCHYEMELPAELGETESLQILTVHERHKGSALKIQEEQQKYGNYQLQVLDINR